MKRKLTSIILVILFALSLVYLSGCQQGGRDTTENYRTGTEGIRMNFLSNAPPNRVYEGNPLQVVVEVENKGAYPQDSDSFEGYLVFSGPTDASVNVGQRTKQIPVDLPGRSYSFPKGGTQTVTFEDNSVQVPSDAEKYDAPILITSCYKYQTIASPTVCIDPNPYDTVKTVKPCTVRENVAIDSGQGGPIVVSRVEEYMTRNTATFRITFRNSDSGQVFKLSSMSDCIDTDLKYNDINRINVQVSSPSLGNADCTPDNGQVMLSNGKGFMTCKFDVSHVGGSAYTEQLRIVMDYGYSDYIKTNVDIINIDE